MTNVPIGAIIDNHIVGEVYLHLHKDFVRIETIMFSEAKSLADALNMEGFETKSIKLPRYYNGAVEIKIPPIGHETIKMAEIIEGMMGHHLVDNNQKRIRFTGEIKNE